jgi:hypothetical protein
MPLMCSLCKTKFQVSFRSEQEALQLADVLRDHNKIHGKHVLYELVDQKGVHVSKSNSPEVKEEEEMLDKVSLCKSRRASFLKNMLDAFDSEDSSKLMNLANTYQVNFWPIQWALSGNNKLSDRDQEVMGEMGKELRRLMGRVHSASRLSVVTESQKQKIRNLFERHTRKLSPEAKSVLPDVLKVIQIERCESLDSKYAHEVVERLGKIVSRVSRLQVLPTLSVANRTVQLAFEEAHRCYLYGFRTACAVLCRATVDSSLREALAAAGFKGALGEEKTFHDVLQLSEAKALLRELHGSADWVRRAGNDAVHDVSKFETEYPSDSVQELLFATREIVEYLYALPET